MTDRLAALREDEVTDLLQAIRWGGDALGWDEGKKEALCARFMAAQGVTVGIDPERLARAIRSAFAGTPTALTAVPMAASVARAYEEAK